jgi:hypothetical protein
MWYTVKIIFMMIGIYLYKNKCKIDAMAYSYNTTYLGSRNQEDHGLKPAWEKVSKIQTSWIYSGTHF